MLNVPFLGSCWALALAKEESSMDVALVLVLFCNLNMHSKTTHPHLCYFAHHDTTIPYYRSHSVKSVNLQVEWITNNYPLPRFYHPSKDNNKNNNPNEKQHSKVRAKQEHCEPLFNLLLLLWLLPPVYVWGFTGVMQAQMAFEMAFVTGTGSKRFCVQATYIRATASEQIWRG